MPNKIRPRKGGFRKLGKGGARVLEGIAWATVSNLPEDFIVGPGVSLPCCYDNVLVEAISDLLVVESGDSRKISLGNIA